MAEYRHITVETAHNTYGTEVVTVTMDRPAQRNALSQQHMLELITALEGVAESEACGVIIAGNGPVFSAGHDFTDMAGSDLVYMRTLLGHCSDLMQLVQSVPQVVIARVHGLATAAGAQLVAACDLAIAAESSGFAAPGGKGGWFCHTPMVTIARSVGRKRALELALTGDTIAPETALDWGLINAVVPDCELVEATSQLMARATRGSRMSKGLGKQTLYRQMELSQTQAYAHASEVMAAASQTHDGQEAMASFIEKRKPAWKNK